MNDKTLKALKKEFQGKIDELDRKIKKCTNKQTGMESQLSNVFENNKKRRKVINQLVAQCGQLGDMQESMMNRINVNTNDIGTLAYNQEYFGDAQDDEIGTDEDELQKEEDEKQQKLLTGNTIRENKIQGWVSLCCNSDIDNNKHTCDACGGVCEYVWYDPTQLNPYDPKVYRLGVYIRDIDETITGKKIDPKLDLAYFDFSDTALSFHRGEKK